MPKGYIVFVRFISPFVCPSVIPSVRVRFRPLTLSMGALQKVLSLGSDYFNATFYQTYFITNLQSILPLTKHIFVIFLPSREKQINSLLLVSVGDTDK